MARIVLTRFAKRAFDSRLGSSRSYEMKMRGLMMAVALAATMMGAAAHAGTIYDVDATWTGTAAADGVGTLTGTITLDPATGLFTDAHLTASGFKHNNGGYDLIDDQGQNGIGGYTLVVDSDLYSGWVLMAFTPQSFVSYDSSQIGVVDMRYFSGDVTTSALTTNASVTVHSAVSAAPEPGVWALMLAGVAMIGLTLRQGRRQRGVALAA